MARIRTIKPEFPQSESMGRVSRDARLCFVQLWTIADDAGRLRGNSRMLASLLFPYDDDAPGLIDGWLSELEREGCIHRYLVDGASYIEVAKWLSHQKIDRPSESKIPSFAEASRSLAKPPRRTKDQGEDQGGDGKGSVGDAPAPPPHNDDPPSDLEDDDPPDENRRGSRLPEDWRLPKPWGEWALSTYPHWTPDVVRNIADAFADHWHSKTGKDATKRKWDATWRNWCRSGITQREHPPQVGAANTVTVPSDAAEKTAEMLRAKELTPEERAAAEAARKALFAGKLLKRVGEAA